MLKSIVFSFFLFASFGASAGLSGDYAPAFRNPSTVKAALHTSGQSLQKSIQRDIRRVFSLFVKPDIKLAKNESDKKEPANRP